MSEIPIVENCELCPRLVACRRQIVNGVGRPTAKILFVGQNPGEEEDIEGRPFVGKSGQLLRLLCDSANIPPGMVYRTNAVRCHSPGNAKPKQEEINNCRPYLLQEIIALKPAVIVALGEIPTTALYGMGNIDSFAHELEYWEQETQQQLWEWKVQLEAWTLTETKLRKLGFPDGKPRKPKLAPKPKPPKRQNTAIREIAGHTLRQQDTGIPLIVSYHPAFLMRGQWHMSELVISHFEKAKRIAEASV